jgi:hypothetical protein
MMLWYVDAADWHRYMEHGYTYLNEIVKKSGSNLSFIQDEEVCRAIVQCSSMPAPVRELALSKLGAHGNITSQVNTWNIIL